MKLFKFILVLFVTVSFSSCSEDLREPTIILSKTNIAGSYSITSLNVDKKITLKTEVEGIIVPFDITSTSKGDTFQIHFKLEEDGSFEAAGQYRTTSTVTPAGGNSETDTSILVTNSSGTFDIDTTNNTINFSSSVGEFLTGTFDVVTFNETSLVLYQEAKETEDTMTTEMKTSISFERN